MADDIYIFTDESDKEGEYFANFYGGALLFGSQLVSVEHALQERKRSLNLYQEIKWQKVTSQYLKKYQAMTDLLFDLVEADALKLRIMFTHRFKTAPALTAYHRMNDYWILYFQFLKHAFGLQYAPILAGTRPHLRLHLDALPDSGERCRVFKEYLLGINRHCGGRLLLLPHHIVEVKSHDYAIMQCLDIVLGAMQFRLNEKHTEKPAGKQRRGKRTIAKEKLYKHINKRIQQTHGSQFNVGISTGQPNGPSDRWTHRYRHWCFEPRGAVIDPSRVKPRR